MEMPYFEIIQKQTFNARHTEIYKQTKEENKP